MAIKIIIAIANCFYVYMWLIFIRCFLTWIPNLNWDNPILFGLKSATDLYLNLFKKIIPPIGGAIDISPIVAMFVLVLIRNGIIRLAILIMAGLGMVS
jgi:uncharacterized protein YggT (Ycf19 family)